MTLEEIKQLAAEPGVQRVEVRPDGTVVLVKSEPVYVPQIVPSPWWPTWIAPTQGDVSPQITWTGIAVPS